MLSGNNPWRIICIAAAAVILMFSTKQQYDESFIRVSKHYSNSTTTTNKEEMPSCKPLNTAAAKEKIDLSRRVHT